MRPWFSKFVVSVVLVVQLQAADKKTTSLEKLIAQQKVDPKGDVAMAWLERDWVGDIDAEDGDDFKLRLEHGGMSAGQIQLYRLWLGQNTGTENPRYVAELPAIDELRRVEKLAWLTEKFGESHDGTEAWVLDGRLHFSAGWTCITRESETRLRYLRLFVKA